VRNKILFAMAAALFAAGATAYAFHLAGSAGSWAQQLSLLLIVASGVCMFSLKGDAQGYGGISEENETVSGKCDR
jgi:hypothetical protein